MHTAYTAWFANEILVEWQDRRQTLNELVARAFVSAGIPVTKEPMAYLGQMARAPMACL